ncbi:MAG: DNA polymerase III subunit gamma/tau, partial [bacterium]
QLAARPVAAPALPDPQSFEQVVALIGEKREVGLQMDVQRFVRPVAFKPGAITYESLDGAPMDLARKLASRLKDWTGRTWLIAANGQGGGETMIEVDRRKRAEERAGIEADPFVVAVMQAFPGAVIGEIKSLAPAVELPSIPDESPDLDD